MNTFAKAIYNYNPHNSNITSTTNGMKAYKSTNSAVLDFFSSVSQLRSDSPVEILRKFEKAYKENDELAIRVLLWARDIRGGAGERKVFRTILNFLDKSNLDYIVKAIINKIPEIGRWDDIFCVNRNIQYAYDIASYVLTNDDVDEGVKRLCAKWMPRKGIHFDNMSATMRRSKGDYRRILSSSTSVVETDMCSNNWENIKFSHVPSNANYKYSKAFFKHAPREYEEFKNRVRSGKETINSKVAYPHDILKLALRGEEDTADLMWNALPNFVGDKKVFPIVDTSGSMTLGNENVNPLLVAVSLGMYLSNKNTGPFHNLLMTFDSSPRYIATLSKTLANRFREISNAPWGGSTNVQASMRLILNTALNANASQSDIPDAVIIFSDMQFDRGTYKSKNENLTEFSKRIFEEHGYKAPNIIYWNLSTSIYKNTPVVEDELGVSLVTGFSPSILKNVLSLNLDKMTPYQVMLDTILSDRYNWR